MISVYWKEAFSLTEWIAVLDEDSHAKRLEKKEFFDEDGGNKTILEKKILSLQLLTRYVVY